MSLKLTLHTTPSVPLEAEHICPDKVAALNIQEIESLTLHHGNQPTPLGEFFKVEGEPGEKIEIEGDLSQVKYIGAAMTRGEVVVNGSVGAHLGAGMSGGTICINGSAGDWVGPEMSGGTIEIKGNAGHMVGSAYRGSGVGIVGGEIIVHGNVRNETGHGMRNGLIAIGGNSGDFTGVNMLAGTIIVLGEMGIRNGAGMKRGTIVSMHDTKMLPTFSYDCTYRPTFLKLYLQHLQEKGLEVEPEQIIGNYARYSGDAVELNRGEILLYKG